MLQRVPEFMDRNEFRGGLVPMTSGNILSFQLCNAQINKKSGLLQASARRSHKSPALFDAAGLIADPQ
jgi:hypothetical protein